MPLCDVRRNRNNRPLQLTCQAKSFLLWKFLCECVNVLDELHTLSPSIKVFKSYNCHILNLCAKINIYAQFPIPNFKFPIRTKGA